MCIKEWILRVLDNCGRNTKLSKNEFIDIVSLNRDSGFSVLAQGARKGSSILFGWLKHGPTLHEVKRPELNALVYC